MARLFYAGVGSRETPFNVVLLMQTLAHELSNMGFWLRSGHAPGADKAFENGVDSAYAFCDNSTIKKEIFLPWKGFEGSVSTYYTPSPEAHRMARRFHPMYDRLSQGAQKLHARNCHQVLGYSLNDPVKFLVCWTEHGQMKGGTATALKIAHEFNVPVFNYGALPKTPRAMSDRVLEFARTFEKELTT